MSELSTTTGISSLTTELLGLITTNNNIVTIDAITTGSDDPGEDVIISRSTDDSSSSDSITNPSSSVDELPADAPEVVVEFFEWGDSLNLAGDCVEECVALVTATDRCIGSLDASNYESANQTEPDEFAVIYDISADFVGCICRDETVNAQDVRDPCVDTCGNSTAWAESKIRFTEMCDSQNGGMGMAMTWPGLVMGCVVAVGGIWLL